MSLVNFIEKLQNKPRYVRIQILWLSVFICMLIIVSLWVISFKYSQSVAEKPKDGQVSQSLNQLKQDTLSLKDAFKASINAFFEDDLELELETEQTGNQGVIQFEKEIKTIKPAKLPLAQ
ncbi:MAG: hypothetical protein ABIF84_00705 [Patescibacteria group bacterium]